jgi:GTP:adenosylcobinamide-phosphate guanylyltransferase
MKNFKDYLVESEKTFAYRIKIVGDVPSGFIKDFREKLKKFDPVSVGEVKTTPILSQPQDFPAFSNESVNIMDAVFRYPATGPQIQQIAELCGLDADRIVISQLNYAEGMDKELLGIEEQNKDLLNSPYPADTKEQRDLIKDYSAVGKDKQVVKNSAEDAVWTVAGGRTPPAETTNDLPQGIKSPMTAIRRPPRPATGRQPTGR